MSKKTMAIISVLAVGGVVAAAVLMGVEKGTVLFSVVGGVLLCVALVLFFSSKKDN